MKPNQAFSFTSISSRLTAIKMFYCLAGVLLISWALGACVCFKSKVDGRQAGPAKHKLGELNTESCLCRRLKSPVYSGLKTSDHGKLIKTQEQNAILKDYCKKQIETIKSLTKAHLSTKRRLAWFEEWYPLLYAAYDDLIQNGDHSQHNIDKFEAYARGSKKAFNCLERQQETMRVSSKRWLDVVSDSKDTARNAQKLAEELRAQLQEAEAEIIYLQDMQSAWQTQKGDIQAELEELTGQNNMMRQLLEEISPGTPHDNSNSAGAVWGGSNDEGDMDSLGRSSGRSDLSEGVRGSCTVQEELLRALDQSDGWSGEEEAEGSEADGGDGEEQPTRS